MSEANFTASPAKLVKFVNGQGQVIKTVRLNRKQRRRLGIKNIPNTER